MDKPGFVYVTYIATTAEKAWAAIVDPKVTGEYWGDPESDKPCHVNVSDWKVGSRWEHQRAEAARTVDVVGTVLESEPPRRLVISWARPAEEADRTKHSRVTFEIVDHGSRHIKLTVTHTDLEHDPKMAASISGGWPLVLSSMKSLLEGSRVPQAAAHA